jgi:hypothetical protein
MAIRGPDEAAEAKAAAAANVEKVVEQMKKAAAEMKKAAAAVEKATEDVVLAAAEVENTFGIGEGEVFEVEKLVAKRVHEGKTQYKGC